MNENNMFNNFKSEIYQIITLFMPFLIAHITLKNNLRKRITELNVAVSSADKKEDWKLILDSRPDKLFIFKAKENSESEKNNKNDRGIAARESLKLIKYFELINLIWIAFIVITLIIFIKL